jgi:hypothetical protein
MDHTNNLSRECRIFCHYLMNTDPDKYILDKYQKAHNSSVMSDINQFSLFDVALLRTARIGPFFTRLMDVYSTTFLKTSLLRKKLILLSAILECSDPSYRIFESTQLIPKPLFFVSLICNTIFFISRLLVASTVISCAYTMMRITLPLYRWNNILWKKSSL